MSEKRDGFVNPKRPKISAMDIWIGQRLKTQRTIRGMTQETLANHCGVARNQVRRWEYANQSISVASLHRAANALGVHPGFFFDGAPPDVQELAVVSGKEMDATAVALATDPELSAIVRRVVNMDDNRRDLIARLVQELEPRMRKDSVNRFDG